MRQIISISLTILLLSFAPGAQSKSSSTSKPASGASSHTTDSAPNKATSKDSAVKDSKPLKGAVDGWKVVQRSTYAGENTVYISSAGTKIASKLFCSIVRMPSKSVVLYNDDTKGYCELTYEQWMQQLCHRSTGTNRKIIKGKEGEVAGIKAVQYYFENTIQGRRKITEEYWTTGSDGAIPSKLTAPLSDLADLPIDIGLPLRITQYKNDGSKTMILDTVSLKPAKVELAQYKSPVGYTKMADPITMVLGAQ